MGNCAGKQSKSKEKEEVYKPSVKVPEPSVQVTKQTVQVTEPPVQVTEPTVQVTEPTVQVTEPTVQGTDPTVQVTDPSVRVTDPTVQVTEPTTQVTEAKTKQVTEPAVQVTDKKPDGNVNQKHQLGSGSYGNGKASEIPASLIKEKEVLKDDVGELKAKNGDSSLKHGEIRNEDDADEKSDRARLTLENDEITKTGDNFIYQNVESKKNANPKEEGVVIGQSCLAGNIEAEKDPGTTDTEHNGHVSSEESNNEKDDKQWLFAKGNPADTPPELEESEFIDKKGPSSRNADQNPTDEIDPPEQMPGHPHDEQGRESNRMSTNYQTESDNSEGNLDTDTSDLGYQQSKFATPEQRDIDNEDEESSCKDTSLQNHPDLLKLEWKKEKMKMKKNKEGTPNQVTNYHISGEIEFLNFGDGKVTINKIKQEETKIVEEQFEPTFEISLKEMEVLLNVAKSVGFISGDVKSGTCWRVGEDMVATAGHVLKDNTWNSTSKNLDETRLNDVYVDFSFTDEKRNSSSLDVFKVEPKVIYYDEGLDIGILQLKKNDRISFPPPLKHFHTLDTGKDCDKNIYLISHNRGEKKGINGGIGIWKPTAKRLKDLEGYCHSIGRENGYTELDRTDRIVIKCEFVGGSSGSPGLIIQNNRAYVVMLYVRGFPDFYYSTQFPSHQKATFPPNKLLQQGVSIGSLYEKLASNILLRNEVFPIEAGLEQRKAHHGYAMAGDKGQKNGKSTDQTPTNCNDNTEGVQNLLSEEQPNNINNYIRQTSQVLPSGRRQNIQISYLTAQDNDARLFEQNLITQYSQNTSMDGNRQHHTEGDPDLYQLSRKPHGKTTPVDSVTDDEWLGFDLQKVKGKQLKDVDIHFLSKALDEEEYNVIGLCFGLDQMKINRIKMDNQRDLCYHILLKWRNMNGSVATVDKLVAILHKAFDCGRIYVDVDLLKSTIANIH